MSHTRGAWSEVQGEEPGNARKPTMPKKLVKSFYESSVPIWNARMGIRGAPGARSRRGALGRRPQRRTAKKNL